MNNDPTRRATDDKEVMDVTVLHAPAAISDQVVRGGPAPRVEPSSEKTSDARSEHWQKWQYVAIVLVGALAGFAYLGRSSFFLDETVSTTLARAPWHRFVQVVSQREANMVLYFLLLRLWIHIGSSEIAVRSLSVIATLGALAIVVILARQLFGNRAALIGGLLFAVDPLAVAYAQDARGYALSLLFVCISSALFVRALSVSKGWSIWAAYAVVSALGAYFSFWAALVPLGHAVSLAFRPRRTLPVGQLIASAAALVVLLVPLGLLIHSTNNTGTNWIAGTSAGRPFVIIRNHVPHALIDLLAVLAILVVAWLVMAWTRRSPVRASEERWPLNFAISWLTVPVAAVILLSLVYKPLLVPRYLLVCFPALVMLVGVGLARLTARNTLAALTILIAASGVGLWRWYDTGHGQNWRGAVAFVVSKSTRGEGVMIFPPYMRIPFEWYLVEHHEGEQLLSAVYPRTAWGVDPLRFDYFIRIDRSVVSRGAEGFREIWLVLSQAQTAPREERGVFAGLRFDGFKAELTHDFEGIEVVKYAKVRLR